MSEQKKSTDADKIGIRVFPDATGFAEELKTKLEQIAANTEVGIRVKLDASGISEQAAAAAAAAQAAADAHPATGHGPAAAADPLLPATQERQKTEEAITKERERAARVDPLDSSYRSKVLEDIKAIGDQAQKIPAGVDGEKLREDLRVKLAEARASIRGDIPVGADGTEFRAKMDALLADARKMTATLDLGADTKTAKAKLDAFKEQVKADSATVKIVADTGSSAAGFASTATGIGSVTVAATAALGVVGFLAGSLASLSALIPASVVGVAAIAGTAVTALSGVGGALGAVNAANKPQQNASDPRLDAMAVADAKQSIVNAENNARDSTVKADRDVADSKYNLQQTIQQVTNAHVAAEKAVVDAERGLQNAQLNVTDAQKALNKAREAAVINLRDLDAQLKNASLSERDAAVHYQNAMDAYNQALTDPSKSNTAIAALKLEMDKAQQQLVDSKYKVDDLSKAKAKAVSEEKTGTDQVQQAQRTLADAQQAVIDAQYKKSQADAAVVKGNVDGQHQIEMAQRAVSDATAAAQKAQVSGAQSVAQAQEALLKLTIQQADAQGKAGKDAELAMAKLTPAAREAVGALIGVKDQFGEIRKTVQENFFTGFTEPLKEAADVILPQLKTGLGSVATSFGQGIQGTLTAMKSSLSGGVLDGILQGVAKGMANANAAVAPFTDSFVKLASVGSTFLPQMGDGFAKAGKEFNDLIQKAAADGSLQKWVQGGLSTLHDLESVLGSVGKLVGDIFKAENAAGGTAFTVLAQNLAHIAEIAGKEPFQGALAKVFQGANQAFTEAGKALAPLADAFVSVAPTLNAIFVDVGKIVGVVGTALAQALSNPQLQKGVQDLFGGILQIVQSLAPVIPTVAGALGQVATVAAQLGAALAPVIADLAVDLSGAITAVLPLLTGLADFISHNKDVVVLAVEAYGAWKLMMAGFTFGEFLAKLAGDTAGWVTNTAAKATNKGETVALMAMYAGEFVSNIAESVVQIGKQTAAWAANKAAVLASKGETIALMAMYTGEFLGNMAKATGAIVVQTGAWIAQKIEVAASALVTAGWTLATGLATAAQWLLDAAMFANPIGLVVLAVAALVAGIWLLLANWDQVSKAFSDFGASTASMFADMGKNFGDFIGGAADGWSKWIDSLKGFDMGAFWGGLQETVVGAINGIFEFLANNSLTKTLSDWVNSAIDWVQHAFDGIGKFFEDAGSNIIRSFADGIRNATGWVGDAVSGVLNFLGMHFPHSPAKTGPLSGDGWYSIGRGGEAVAKAFAGGITTGTPDVGAASDGLMRAVSIPTAATLKLPGGAAAAPGASGGPSIVNNIHEAISARATAIEVNRLQGAGV